MSVNTIDVELRDINPRDMFLLENGPLKDILGYIPEKETLKKTREVCRDWNFTVNKQEFLELQDFYKNHIIDYIENPSRIKEVNDLVKEMKKGIEKLQNLLKPGKTLKKFNIEKSKTFIKIYKKTKKLEKLLNINGRNNQTLTERLTVSLNRYERNAGEIYQVKLEKNEKRFKALTVNASLMSVISFFGSIALIIPITIILSLFVSPLVGLAIFLFISIAFAAIIAGMFIIPTGVAWLYSENAPESFENFMMNLFEKRTPEFILNFLDVMVKV